MIKQDHDQLLAKMYRREAPKITAAPITYPAQIWYYNTYKQLQGKIKSPTECQAVTRLLLADFLNYNATKHVLNEPLSISFESFSLFRQAIEKLSNNHPIQYVLGYADFADHRFEVNPAILIPRPETAEMTAYIIDQCTIKTPRILDIGTGSGCIAITLAKAFPDATVTALDIALPALIVARRNAEKMKVTIDWWQHDILTDFLPQEAFWDLIVSNPPYIPLEEKKQMEARVVAHEPHNALFVPQDNPLLFYEKIATIAQEHLANLGYLYIEVHENYAKDVAQLLVEQGMLKVTLHEDIHGKKRWVEAQKDG